MYQGVMFRARAYADGLEHPRLWGIAGTVSAAPGRGAKARRASSNVQAVGACNARRGRGGRRWLEFLAGLDLVEKRV